MDVAQKGVCIITFPMTRAFIIPLENLVEIISSISNNVYLIIGCSEKIPFKKVPMLVSNISEMPYIAHKNTLMRIFYYVNFQIKISIQLFKERKNIDTCIFFFEAGPIIPLLIAKLLNKNIIWILPSSYMDTSKHYDKLHRNKVFLNILKLCYLIPDKIVVYSNNLINEWKLQKYQSKIIVTHRHIVDLSLFNVNANYRDRKLKIGYIGRLSQEKGIYNFLKSIKDISKAIPNSEFIITGDGPLKNDITKYMDENNLNGIVTINCWVPHEKLPQSLNELKLLVIPSYTEGLPNIMIESMACGTPILASSIGAIPDVIKNNQNGLLLPDNSSETIAKAVISAFQTSDLEQISKNGRLFVEKEFDLKSAIERYKKVLN